ncbi:sentrin-specific protease 5-like [Aphis craccivora]|uniref:Sentrin-specific protease 5-like n=1 Tax=Aphis craccivora TaxID=307492 RepID=A0A6G0ZD37_APHCR|nr:sentrin-specific protease 5-like [Aphis craccivora]
MNSNERKPKELIEELTLDNYSLEDYVEGRSNNNISVDNLQNSHEEQTGFNIKSYFINSVVFFDVCSEDINAFCEMNNTGSINVNGLRHDNKCNMFRVFEVYKTYEKIKILKNGVGKAQSDWISLLDDDNKSSVQLPEDEPTVGNMGILNKINYIEKHRSSQIFPDYSKETLSRIKNNLSIRTLKEVLWKNENVKQFVQINDLIQIIQPDVWLNDAAINFYIRLLVKQSQQNVLAIDSQFFLKSGINGNTNVLHNTFKNIKVFEYSRLIIPIHLEAIQHWVLITVEPRAKTITYFDSCANSRTFNVLSTKISLIVSVLNIIYRAQERYVPTSTWKIKCGNSPLQNNMNDCGVFVCTNARYVVFNKQINYTYQYSVLLRQRITYEILINKILPTL